MTVPSGVIDIPVFTDAKVPTDESATADDTLRCLECGKPLVYAGRGRKPKYCEEHRKSSSKSAGPRKGAGNNATLAAQATDALCQVHGLVASLGYVTGFPMTASAIAGAEDGFREQAYNALLTDPDLCKAILRAGTTSGRVALLIAYGMFAGAVAPTAVMEFKERRELAKAKAAEEYADDGAVNVP
jgi:hypothetical protein